MIRVLFENIGKECVSWDAELHEFSPFHVLRELRQSRVLYDLPDIMWDAARQRGTVWINGKAYAGKFRIVG